jgi:hypothetical protein
MNQHKAAHNLLFQIGTNVDQTSSNFIQGRVGPVSEPVDDTSVENGWGRGGSVLELIVVGIHSENDVKISLNIFGK